MSTSPGSAEPVLELRGLSKRYGSRLAVDDLSLTVRRGEILGFLGPNGAGKTTTIRMALGLVQPTAGTVRVLGRELHDGQPATLSRVGALIEAPALYPSLTGRDNLRVLGTCLWGGDDARVDAVLQLVGLAGRAHDRVRTYSLGMKQRLGVGLALLPEPDLLVLDEPGNGLDPAGVVQMRQVLRQAAAQGAAVLVSTHVLHQVEELCTHVAIIDRGRLVRAGSVAELTRPANEFEVGVGRPHAALAALHGQPWGASARLVHGRVVAASPTGSGRDLWNFLAQAGHAPKSIAERQVGLEDLFLQLTIEGDRQ